MMKNIKVDKLFFYIVPYALLVSSLFLLGYWGVFEINIFEFISIHEVILLVLYSLFVPLLSILIGSFLGYVLMVPFREFKSNTNVSKTKYVKDSQINILFKKIVFLWTYTLFLTLFLRGVYLIIVYDFPSKYLAAGFLATPLIFLMIYKSDYLNSVFFGKNSFSTPVCILLFLLITSYGWGAVFGEENKDRFESITINGEKVKMRFLLPLKFVKEE